MSGHNTLIFICFSWFTLLESPSGISKSGCYVGEQTIVSGHLTGTFAVHTAACLVGAIIKYERHILFSLMCRCVKFLLSTTGHIQEENGHPGELGSKAWCFIIAGYVFSSNASAELLLQQDRMSSYFQLLFMNKGIF